MTSGTLRFGLFELDVRSGELRRQGLKVKLADQPGRFLLMLLERPGHLVTREELRERLWPADTFVDFDAALNSAIKKVRQALGDSAEQPRFIETIPKRGYRFIAPVDAQVAAHAAAPSETQAVTHSGTESGTYVGTHAGTHSATRVEPGASPARPPAPPRGRWRWSPPLLLAATIIVALTWLVADVRRTPPATPPIATSPIRSIVVLPFENLTGDPGQQYFVDGMTDALTTTLAQIKALRVISRTSALQYAGARKPLSQIARELDVDAVIEGTVARGAGRVRVTAQLIDASADRHVWAERYERETRDLMVLQDELAAAIAGAIHVEVLPDERPRLIRRPVRPDAYDAYLKGRFAWNRRDLLRAAAHFEEAIAQDPSHAAAYAGLSDVYRQCELAPRPECLRKAEAAARQALALDDTLAEAHASLGGVLAQLHYDWPGAERAFRRSLALDPNYAEGHRAYAVHLLTMHRHAEGLAMMTRARDLSPFSEIINAELAGALLSLRRTDDAFAQLEKTRQMFPESARVSFGYATAHHQRGDLVRTLAAVERGVALTHRQFALEWLGYAYAISGQRAAALRVLAELEARAAHDYVMPQSFAIVYLGLGDKRRTLAWLERAYDRHELEVPSLMAAHVFDLLRDDPRFQALLRRIHWPAIAQG